MSYANDFQASGPATAVKQRLILEPIKENAAATTSIVVKSRNIGNQIHSTHGANLNQGRRKALSLHQASDSANSQQEKSVDRINALNKRQIGSRDSESVENLGNSILNSQ